MHAAALVAMLTVREVPSLAHPSIERPRSYTQWNTTSLRASGSRAPLSSQSLLYFASDVFRAAHPVDESDELKSRQLAFAAEIKAAGLGHRSTPRTASARWSCAIFARLTPSYWLPSTMPLSGHWPRRRMRSARVETSRNYLTPHWTWSGGIHHGTRPSTRSSAWPFGRTAATQSTGDLRV